MRWSLRRRVIDGNGGRSSSSFGLMRTPIAEPKLWHVANDGSHGSGCRDREGAGGTSGGGADAFRRVQDWSVISRWANVLEDWSRGLEWC